ncbi:MAG: ABC transporter ATP-binding protein [Armatimonadetes bacterium]|nr:ABC transporter ATP-binding protein [Armatimonadota bacterium]
MKVDIQNLVKEYEGGVTALKEISLTIQEGVFGLLGPNGSGKTTLMSIIATLREPTRGTVMIGSHDVRYHKPEIRGFLGYLPQEIGFYPSLTAYELLDYMGLLYNITDTARRRRVVEEAMELTNLTQFRDRKVGTFSGGMRQRLGIAQALLNSPQLLIVDEPTAGLDPEERIRIRSLLAELGSDRVIILSTHIVADVEAVADTLAILHKGNLLFSGTPEDMLQKVSGNVWLLDLSREDLIGLKDRYLETGVFRTRGGVQLRVVAEKVDHPNAVPATPTLEDAYMWIMGDSNHAG